MHLYYGVNAVSSYQEQGIPFLIYSLFMESVVTLVRYVHTPHHTCIVKCRTHIYIDIILWKLENEGNESRKKNTHTEREIEKKIFT